MRHFSAVPWVLFVALAGCGDVPTAPANGRLSLAISGLPPDAPSVVTVAGPGGFTASVEDSRTLADLRAGTYVVSALDVTAGGSRYVATPATQSVDVASGAPTAAGEIAYAIATARLAVSVLGLPSGLQGSVSVSGPGGFSAQVTSTTTLNALAPGTYTVSAAAVSSGSRTYLPELATQSIALEASPLPAPATIAYGAGRGSLAITIDGLPAGASAPISVTGPGSFSRTVVGPTTLVRLDPGTYVIASGSVGSNLVTYTPAAATQSAGVTDNATTATTIAYQGAPLKLRLDPVADGLTAPVFLTSPGGDARQFVVERNGRIRVIANGVLLAAPFLDISSRVNFIGERGMLGMAFDPRYATNGRFFVYYVGNFGEIIVERFSSTPGGNVAGASDGFVFAAQHGGSEHHGGHIAFGPDGMLYLGPGDGGCCGDPSNNAQNKSSLLGKLLRIDVRNLPYAIPPTNPFAGGGGGGAPEVWALGLRNPWRFAFDTVTRLLYVTDVGQDLREEVNVVSSGAAGVNYGWRLMEGTSCFNPASNCATGGSLTLPVVEYTHAEGCSVIGGEVYRGSAIPELVGHYLYSDFCGGWLRSFRGTATGTTDHQTWSGVSLTRPVSLSRDGMGELYMIAGSRVWRIARN